MVPRTRNAALLVAPVTLVALLSTVGLSSSSAAPPTDNHSPAVHAPSWRITPTGSTEEFRGLAAVSSSTVWVSGEQGSVLRSDDAGASWHDVSPPQAADMALRDIEALGHGTAVTLAIGQGDESRIFITHDRGTSWTETFRNPDPDAFYDCLAFSADGSGLAMSDPVDGRFQLARTADGGDTWAPYTPDSMPAALDGEFGFAASGTCLVSGPGHTYWFASGGVDQPRVFRSSDGGRTWTVHVTALRGGPSAGIYSLDFRTPRQGIAVGGDYAAATDGSDAAAVTRDGGRSWANAATPLGGYRSGVAYLPRTAGTVVAVGPTGSDISRDGGRTWATFDTDRYDGIQCARDGACWGSGTEGRVARLIR